MTDWMIWFALAGILVIFELFIGTLYLLMIGIGLIAGGVAALFAANITWQFLLAATIGIVATYVFYRGRLGNITKIDASCDPNINLDIGQKLLIERWENNPDGSSKARALYRGAMWDIELKAGENAVPGIFIIHEVRGSHLIVSG